MESRTSEHIPQDGTDIRLLSSLIIELNIARRNFRSYPKGHPIVDATFHKVISLQEKLLENIDEIIIGVAKDVLMVNGTSLDKGNIVFKDFAKVLFEHGIGLLLLRRGLTLDELKSFNLILGLKRDEIIRHGGIEALWEKGHIVAIGIKPIRYDLFSEADDTSGDTSPPPANETLWERFTSSLIAGSFGSSDGNGDGAGLDPEIVASMLNSRFEEGEESLLSESGFADVVTELNRQQESNHTKDSENKAPYEKLASFISRLNPELRRQFLASTFDIKKTNGAPVTGDILGCMSSASVIETLDDINSNNVKVPPVIMGLLQKLSSHADHSDIQTQTSHQISDDELGDRMRTIFSEHASEEFIPDDYQKKLNSIISDKTIFSISSTDAGNLLKTVDEKRIEERIGDIIMNIVRESDDDPEEREILLQNLGDMFCYFLQTGDYTQLIKMIDQVTDGSFPIAIQYRLKETYARRDFLDEIMEGLTVWGKPRYDDIRLLIRKIGSPFIEVLLDHLANEDNMSLRRFMMDRLIEMGHMTRVPIANRLDDDRWFVLRNLIIILGSIEDESVAAILRPLTRHKNPKVRSEVFRVLLHYNDPAAERQIQQDLDSPDREVQLAAVHLAEKSRSPETFSKLIAIITKSGMSQLEYELKSAVVMVLGEIGRLEVLPELAKILASRNLLHPRLLARLKTDVVRSLESYPPGASLPVLETIAKGSDDLAIQARNSLRSLQAKIHER